MRFIPGCLLLMLLVSTFSSVHGVLETPYTRFKCQCLQHTRFLPKRIPVERLVVYPPGNGCSTLEVIIWLKNGSVLCLDPTFKGTLKFLKDLKNLQSSRLGASRKKTQNA